MDNEVLFDEKLVLKWDSIQEYRDLFTKMFSNISDFNKDKISIIILVISELLENIVKYTRNKTCYLTLYLEISDKKNILHITAENERSSEYETEYYALLDIVNKINSYDDYDKMYMDFAIRSISDPNEKSRFGLALIRKLLEGNPIVISDSKKYPKGVKIDLEAYL